MRRVVVTGMGIVSSIGNTTQEVLANLREAKSGISRADKYAELGFRCQVHGAPSLDPSEVVDRRAMRFLGGGAAWNHVAMDQAIRDADHNPLGVLLTDFPELRAIAFNGATAAAAGRRLLAGHAQSLTLIDLPSSSAAHAIVFAAKAERWAALRQFSRG